MAQTLLEPACSELLIRKSRFIGCVQPIADRSDAVEVIETLRRQHPAAAHVCWAMLAGGQSAAVDDGEPSGTAGRPMLEVLRHQDLDGVMASVVRYFGGVKLGAGGLLRAYTDCIAQALLGAEKQPLQHWVELRCSMPYSFEGRFRRELDSAGARVEQISHGAAVDFRFCLPEHEAMALQEKANGASQGRIHWLGSGN